MPTRDIEAYEASYTADYGFEREMVHYRRRHLIERLQLHKPRRVIEIGCGSELLAGAWLRTGGTWDNWTVVEPGRHFAEAASAAAKDIPNLAVIHGFFEDVAPSLKGDSPDFVLCSALLHEVIDPHRLVTSITEVMRPGSVALFNVPQAHSLHRRLAVAMGLIDDPHQLGGRNQQLQQQRVYDQRSLNETLESCGALIQATGGYFLKPFAHSQMEAISAVLTREVLDGLYELGKNHPDWASEIFAEITLKQYI